MAYIYSMFYFCLILQIKGVKNCRSENDIHRFGDNCDFMCHCKDNDECDVTSGECTSGCARGWFGPGCQYRDLAAKGRTRRNPDHATDGDVTTCSETRRSWSVQFNTYELITEIHIVTKPDKLHLFKRFTVTVEDDKGYPHDCYRHGNEAPKQERIVLICNNRLFGNKVTINLAETETLVLCDVKINGGRNLAFNREASQISVHHHCNTTCTAEKAVDGHDNRLSWIKCSHSKSEYYPWWKVNLGYLARIRRIRILSVIDEGRYVIEVSNNTDDDSGMTPNHVKANVGVDVIGRFIKVTRRESNRWIIICEIYVYGDCIEDMCGFDCKKTCHCQNASIQDKMTGLCSECDAGTFGVSCQSNCSSNCKHRTCDLVNGRCSSGCKPGYREDKCDKNCTSGYFGEKCEENCSRFKCKGGYKMCSNIDGHCLNGCQAGWNGKWCDSVCRTGTFGIGCKNKCPSNCKDDYCDYSNGTCTQGCKPGYQGSVCKEKCDAGFYGENCTSVCGRCKSRIACNHVNGTCYGGCETGYTGDICLHECDAGFYGENCTSVCGRCKSGIVCNHVIGTCYGGCETGYTGDICLQEEKIQHAGSVPKNKEVPHLKLTLIIIGIISAVLLLYAIVITVLFKRNRMQIARLERQRKGSTSEAGIALSSDRVDETSHYTALSPQRTENTIYEAVNENELSA